MKIIRNQLRINKLRGVTVETIDNIQGKMSGITSSKRMKIFCLELLSIEVKSLHPSNLEKGTEESPTHFIFFFHF